MTPPSRVAVARARLLGAAFELLYRNRTLYWLASTIPFAGQWRRWQRLVLPILAAQGGVRDVLELGCGPGWLFADLCQAGYDARAVDRSPQMVAATRSALRRRLPHLREAEIRGRVAEADARALPFADATFDAVVSTFPTDYIFDPAVAREIARVLRPGGLFVIVLGASLVPTRLLAWPFVAFQTLAYGRGGSMAPRCASSALATRDADGQPRLPFASAGLVAQAECVGGPFWVAYLVRAEKPSAEKEKEMRHEGAARSAT